MNKRHVSPEARSWMLGYYTGMQEAGLFLSDIDLTDISKEYKDILRRRAEKAVGDLPAVW